jgi:hypothetical protein
VQLEGKKKKKGASPELIKPKQITRKTFSFSILLDITSITLAVPIRKR